MLARQSQTYNVALGVVAPLVAADPRVSSDRAQLVAAALAVKAVEEASRSDKGAREVAQEIVAEGRVSQLQDSALKAVFYLNENVKGWKDQPFADLSVEDSDSITALETRISAIKATEFYKESDQQAEVNRYLSNLIKAYKGLYELGAAGAEQ